MISSAPRPFLLVPFLLTAACGAGVPSSSSGDGGVPDSASPPSPSSSANIPANATTGCGEDKDCALVSSENDCCSCGDTSVLATEKAKYSSIPKASTCKNVKCARCVSAQPMCAGGQCAVRRATSDVNVTMFDATCTSPDDCVLVSTFFACCEGGGNAAINKAAKAAYDAAYATMFDGFSCELSNVECTAAIKTPRCEAGKCAI